jgi:hypothetical protein
MNSIIAFALKVSGFQWVWDKINGYKTKIAATGLMLSGASMMLAGASSILMTLYACGNMACVIELIRSFATNPSAKTLMEGFVVFNTGLGGLGIGHKLTKMADGPVVPPVLDAVRGLADPAPVADPPQPETAAAGGPPKDLTADVSIK